MGVRRCVMTADEGSGTMLAVALIALVGVLLGMSATVGAVLLCRTRVRSFVDVAALSAAVALRDGSPDPCAVAGRVAEWNGARVLECEINGEDVVVSVEGDTSVPLAPHVVQRSRAGPVPCV